MASDKTSNITPRKIQDKKVTRCNCIYRFQVCYSFDFKFVVFHFNNYFKFNRNLLMKIHENFHEKGIFHHDKSKRMKVYTRTHLVSMPFRLAELCSTRNQCICFQVILCFCLFLIQNIQEDNEKIKKYLHARISKLIGCHKINLPKGFVCNRFLSIILLKQICFFKPFVSLLFFCPLICQILIFLF